MAVSLSGGHVEYRDDTWFGLGGRDVPVPRPTGRLGLLLQRGGRWRHVSRYAAIEEEKTGDYDYGIVASWHSKIVVQHVLSHVHRQAMFQQVEFRHRTAGRRGCAVSGWMDGPL